MNRDSIILSITSLLVVLGAGFFVLKISDETSHSILESRLKTIEEKVNNIEQTRFTNDDHANYLQQKLAADEITQTRFVRIFDRLRSLEEFVKDHDHLKE